MENRQLRYFVAVAETLHFGRAAERLHLAQPSLSHQILALEHELGVSLLRRTKRRVELTAAGERLLDEAYKILEQTDRAVALARQAGRGEIGSLRVGFLSSVAYGNLPRLLRAFQERSPGIHLELRELTTPDLQRALETGEVDVGFFRLDASSALLEATPGLSWQRMQRDPYVIALPEDHPLAARPAIALGALAQERFVLFPRRLNPGLHDLITRHCREAGFEPRITQEATLMQTLIALVAAGLGVTFAPTSMQVLRLEGVCYRPLEAPGIEAFEMAAWRRDDDSPALQAFREMLRELAT
ncbi:MAG TPA: LysR family transcriptional regulator [Oscillatoriaceae cyanobacterium]